MRPEEIDARARNRPEIGNREWNRHVVDGRRHHVGQVRIVRIVGRITRGDRIARGIQEDPVEIAVAFRIDRHDAVVKDFGLCGGRGVKITQVIRSIDFASGNTGNEEHIRLDHRGKRLVAAVNVIPGKIAVIRRGTVDAPVEQDVPASILGMRLQPGNSLGSGLIQNLKERVLSQCSRRRTAEDRSEHIASNILKDQVDEVIILEGANVRRREVSRVPENIEVHRVAGSIWEHLLAD